MNFIPREYLRNGESSRTNLMYIGLLLIVMAGLVITFWVIQLRLRAYNVKEKLVDAEMVRRKVDINYNEELQSKSTEMWKAALTASELLEPVSRSVLLAELTNNMPQDVTFLRLDLIQKMPLAQAQAKKSKYQEAKDKILKETSAEQKVSPEQLLEIHIDIEAIAPSDLHVATYIERLGSSNLIENVILVESKEYTLNDTTFRRFKLKAMLKKDARINEDDINAIAMMAKEQIADAR